MMLILEITFLVVLLLIAAATALSETSLISVSRLRLRRLSLDGSRQAKLILKILETPEKFFGTILVINNIVDTLIASILTAMMIAVTDTPGKGVVIATVIATFFIIVFEVVAKTFAARHSERTSLALARPVNLLIYISYPLIRGLAVVTNSIVNMIGGDIKTKDSLVTEEEIRAFIKISGEVDLLHKEKYKMLSKVFDFSETIVRAVMTPKKNVVSVSVDAKVEENIDKALESGYSRMPVYKDSENNIIGIINIKDLLNLSVNKGVVVFQDIIYPPVVVSGAKKVTELLKEFKKGHTHLAIVVDQAGRVEGIVTLEDLLEEIVGEIEDEYDIRGSFNEKHF